MAMNFKPTSDRVIVRPETAPEKTAGGIIFPNAGKEVKQRGKVIAVGPGKTKNGIFVPMQVSIGDNILFGKYEGTEIEVDGDDYIIMREQAIMAIVE